LETAFFQSFLKSLCQSLAQETFYLHMPVEGET